MGLFYDEFPFPTFSDENLEEVTLREFDWIFDKCGGIITKQSE